MYNLITIYSIAHDAFENRNINTKRKHSKLSDFIGSKYKLFTNSLIKITNGSL